MTDAAPRTGTMVIRHDQVLYASDGLAALVGRTIAEIVGRSPLDLFIPEDRARIADVRGRWDRGEPVPRSLELTLLRADGGHLPVECAADRDGPESIVHFRDLGAQAARRLRLDALAAIGAGIRNERSEDAVHARIRADLEMLGLASVMMTGDADGERIVWISIPTQLRDAFVARIGSAPEGFAGQLDPFGRRALDAGAAFSDDWATSVAAFLPPEVSPLARTLVLREGFSRAIGVRVDASGQGPLLLVVAGPWLEGEDVPAVRLFGAQVAAALDAARVISDLSRRNAHLAALNRVAELAGEASDLSVFFARASEVIRPAAGYAGCAVFVPDEPTASLVRVYAEGGTRALDDASPRLPLASPLGDVLRDRVARAVEVPFPGGDPAFMAAMGFRSLAWVPLVARSRAVGLLAAGFDAGLEVARGSIDLLSAAGAHFASAIESHGLLSDLRRRVGELTLLVDVAQASAQLDPVLLLESALRRVSETIGADLAAAYLRDGDRLVLLSAIGLDTARVRSIAELEADGGAPGLAMRRLAPVATDIRSAFGAAGEGEGGVPSGPAIAVPLLANSQAVGALLLGRADGSAFGGGDAALLSSIGVQLGVAVDSARLFSDVRRRLADLQAVHALALRVFANAPGDVAALLQDGCVEIARALSARAASIFLASDDRTRLRAAASVGVPRVAADTAIELERDAFSAEVMRSRVPLVSDDLTRDPRSIFRGRKDVPPLAMLAVPLVSRSEVRGIVYVGDPSGRRFSPGDVALANALAGALGVGVENAELYADARRRVEENAQLYVETRRRAEELGLLHEVGRSLVETLDIEQVLGAAVRNLARIVDAPDAYLALASEDGQRLEFRAVTSRQPGLVGRVVPVTPADDNLASRVFASKEPLVVEDARSDARVHGDLQDMTGGRAYLSLPLVVRDRAIGAVVIVETRGPRLFTPAEVERASAIANQLAVAADNARLYEDLRRSYAQLARAQQQLLQGERLAALGELSAIVAHEVRNPLGVIFNSIGSLRRLVRPTGDAKMLFDIVEEEADRLNRIVGDLLDFARPSTPEVRPEQLDRVVDDAIGAAVAQQGTRIELTRDFDAEVPAVAMDPRLVRQAVLNVAVNAVQAMPRGGRITVRTRRDGDHALLEIEDTGAGIVDEVRERIFEPFFTTKASGTGLGLAVVKRIVEGHGGAVSVRSTPGSGTVFALRFPLAGPPAR